MISVCMPTFNGEKYVYQQLESILQQLSDDDEIIISDDTSSDNTIEIIKNFNDKRIKILRHQKYGSPIFNLENALKNAIGDYVFLADQDDIWLPNKIELMMRKLRKYDCVISDAFIIDADEKIIYNSFFDINKSRKGIFYNFIKNGYLGCCMAFNKKMLKYILPFPSNIPMHDIWIGSISELFGKTTFYSKPLIYYRRHGSNYSMASEKSKNSLITKLMYRYNLLFNLIRRYVIR